MNKIYFLILGFCLSILFPPYFFFPIGFVVLPVICYLIDTYYKNLKLFEKFVYSFLFGLTFFGNLLFWIKNPFLIFDETKYLVLLSLILIFILSLIFSIIFTLIIHNNKLIATVFIVPIIFIATEFTISFIGYGFPWVTFSLIVSNIDIFLKIIKNYGTIVTSYITLQMFCLPYLFFSKKIHIKTYYFVVILIITPLISIIFLNNFNFNNKEIDEKKISIEYFQLNNSIKFQNNFSKDKYNKIVNLISNSKAEVLIFAENNYPYLIKDKEISIIQNIITNDQTVILGGTRIENKKYFNSLFAITKSDILTFDKKILVPFGEFLPFRTFLSFFEPIAGSIDYSSSSSTRLIDLNKSLNFIPVICYEIIFYWKIINQINVKSDLIINITNDKWFGKYLGPYQHFYLTKIRASEFNKPIIRVSNNGISAVIDNNGVILSSTALNIFSTKKYNLKLKNHKSFYNLHVYLNYYFLLIIIILLILNFRKKNGIN